MENLRRAKNELRKKILAERNLISVSDIKDKSVKIKEKLFDLKEFRDAQKIMFFVSFRSEVMTDFMIRDALAIHKIVAVPLSVKHSHILKIFYINDFNTDLTVGTYGILEPKTYQCKMAKKSELDIIIIPGAAFTTAGDRIGYGAGYYDRFLKGLPNDILKIALAYEHQIVPYIPVSEDDVRVDMIITDERIINCRG